MLIFDTAFGKLVAVNLSRTQDHYKESLSQWSFRATKKQNQHDVNNRDFSTNSVVTIGYYLDIQYYTSLRQLPSDKQNLL